MSERQLETRRCGELRWSNKIKGWEVFIPAGLVAQISLGLPEHRRGELFDSLADVRRKLSFWRYDYNNVRPHSSLQNRTPGGSAATISTTSCNITDDIIMRYLDRYTHKDGCSPAA